MFKMTREDENSVAMDFQIGVRIGNRQTKGFWLFAEPSNMNQIQEAVADHNLQRHYRGHINQENHLKCSVCWEASCPRPLQVAVASWLCSVCWVPGSGPGLRISHSSELPGLAATTNKILQIIKLIVYSRQEEQWHKEGDWGSTIFQGEF